jgi:predicted nucleic acid-binding protein
LKAKWDRAGLNVPALDDQIAATAHRRGVVVITRNVRDFEGTGVQVHNPFEG